MHPIKEIQKWMKLNNLDLFLINRTDEFNNEYIAPYAERVKWISNFSGSAAKLIISKNTATIFVDGRYTLQANQEIKKNILKVDKFENYLKRLKKIIYSGFIVGLDPKLHSILEINNIKKILKNKKSKIIYLSKNPIDLIWKNQPKYPNSLAFIHLKKYSGISAQKKILEIQSILKHQSINYFLLTSLDSIAWLLNIRANDIKFTPLLLSYAIIPSSGKIELFVNKNKIINIKKKLSRFVNFKNFNDIPIFLKNLNINSVIGIDEQKTNFYFLKRCEEHKFKIKILNDPCQYLKSQKNSIEIAGAKKSNIRDGVSLTKFIFWIKNKIKIKDINELNASKYLEKLRKKNKLFYSLSFETISAIGKNAAIPHYRLTKESHAPFKNNSIYLIDSGAQYLDGTTDITRTIIIGKPTKEHKDRFTRVLKGHIELATAKFSNYTTGSSIDYLARKYLKEIGYDYDHGTGHGIGSFLGVHEGPQRISKIKNNNDAVLREGMILSNEPGFYKKNSYGIRTENLILVCKKNNYLFFETISFAPFDIDLIDKKMMNKKEINWINEYHENVFKKLKNKLSLKEKEWLKKVTKPI